MGNSAPRGNMEVSGWYGLFLVGMLYRLFSSMSSPALVTLLPDTSEIYINRELPGFNHGAHLITPRNRTQSCLRNRKQVIQTAKQQYRNRIFQAE